MKRIIFNATMLIISMLLTGNPVFAVTNSDELEKGLQLMREEEKLAHDVYIALYEKWQIPIFNNIARSESRHFDAVGYLLENFGVKDPAHEKPGKFNSKTLAKLYDELVEKGSESLTAALEVGAYIEELDIQDLQDQLDADSDEMVTLVFGNLKRASENHLRAFTSQLEAYGLEYNPQVLDQEIFLTIIDSDTNRRGQKMRAGNTNLSSPKCGQNNRQKGNGRGMGNCRYN